MRKLFTVFFGVFLLLGASQLRAATGVHNEDDALRSPNDIATWQQKGSSDVALGIGPAGTVYNTDGLFNYEDIFIDPPAASSGAFRVGGIEVATNSLLSGAASTYYTADIASQPVPPRNIVIYASATTIGYTTTTLVGTATFYGLDALGNQVSEGITFSTAAVVIGTFVPVNIVGGTSTYLRGQGKVAFAFISSFTIQITSRTDTYNQNVSFFIGYGNRLGLSNDVREYGDVYSITEHVAAQAVVSGRVDPIYNTYTPVTIPNGQRRYRIRYRVKNSPKKT